MITADQWNQFYDFSTVYPSLEQLFKGRKGGREGGREGGRKGNDRHFPAIVCFLLLCRSPGRLPPYSLPPSLLPSFPPL
jgi:hypothetical protein